MRAEKKLNALIYFAVICILAKECCGVLVGEEKRLCPVCEEQIAVLEIASFGSYIYDRESKYDLIYFPYDDPRFIYMCPYCGYAQLAKYFADLSSEEKNKLKDFLSANWEPASPNDIAIDAPNDISAIDIRLNQAILVNKFLERDEDFWAWFNRVLIFHYRKIDPDRAKALATDEIELLQKGKGKFYDLQKSRNYLLGEYYRMTGNTELARKHLSQAWKTDIVSEVKLANAVLIVLEFILLCLLLFTWIKKGVARKSRVIYTIVFITVFAICSFTQYWIPELARQREYMNKYYNEIIADRLELLYTQSPNRGIGHVLTREDIIQKANDFILSLYHTLEFYMEPRYDVNNAEWQKVLTWLVQDHPDFANQYVESLTNRHYQAVRYDPNYEVIIGEGLWIFVDVKTGEIITHAGGYLEPDK